MDVGLDEDVDAANAVERDLDVLVIPPVAHTGHIDAIGLVFLVACERTVSDAICADYPERFY